MRSWEYNYNYIHLGGCLKGVRIIKDFLIDTNKNFWTLITGCFIRVAT